MVAKLLSGFETILLLPAIDVNGSPSVITATGVVPVTSITAAVLNQYISITTGASAQGNAGGNISCAVVDDLSLGLTGSDTDDTKTVCSKGQTETPTFYNFDAELNILRDEDLVAAGLYNLARDLTRAPDVPYVIAHRVKGGKDSTENAEIGDEWDYYYVWTDNPVPGYGDGENLTIALNFIPKGWVSTGQNLAA